MRHARYFRHTSIFYIGWKQLVSSYSWALGIITNPINNYNKSYQSIGSGVIEGLCRSFVKDRMELSGMRWTEIGAEAMLELRSAKVNGVWTEFWDYYIDAKKNELYQNQDTEFENAA